MAAQGSLLAPAERRCLQAICEALLPSLEPGDGDDPGLFAASANSLGIAQAIEGALAELDKAQQAQFRLLLRALEQPLLIQLLGPLAAPRITTRRRHGTSKGFSRLSQSERELVLL